MIDKETAYRKEQSLLAKLPLSKEAIMIDASARAFYHCLLRGDDPYTVIDQMLVHYTKVNSELYEKLKHKLP